MILSHNFLHWKNVVFWHLIFSFDDEFCFFWSLSIKWFLKNCIAQINDVAWFFYRNVFFETKRIMIRYCMNFDFTKIWLVKTDWFRTNCSFLIESFVEMKFDHCCVKIEMFCWQDFVFYECVKQVADVKFDCKDFEIAFNNSSIMKNWNRSILLLKKIDEVKNFVKKKFRRKKVRRILIFKNYKTNFVKKDFWKKKWKNFILFCAFQILSFTFATQ